MIRPVFTKDVIILLNLFKKVLPFKKYETMLISNESDSVSFRWHIRLVWFKRVISSTDHESVVVT